MKLKALLLGSAAALIAVSGARAADAVVAEPEPMEYVKVCDMYGSGFHYIPGTETCMSTGGYVRLDYTFNSNDDDADTDRYSYRARYEIDVRNETDWGTLRSQIRFQGDGDADGDAAVGVDRALISVGGFRMGYSDSFTTTHHGYGIPVEKYDGYYGYDQAMFIDYTYAANGFSATIGVQDSVGTSDTAESVTVDLEGLALAVEGGHGDIDHWDTVHGNGDGVVDVAELQGFLDDYGLGDLEDFVTRTPADNTINPDIYIGASYTGGMFSVAGSYIYETDVEEGAWKVSASVTPIDGFTIKGFYVGDSSGDTRQVEGTGEWAYGVGASYQVTDTLNLRGGYNDRDEDDLGQFVVGLKWDPIPGLSIRPEAAFNEDDSQNYSVRVYRTF